jgi:hypothetical protein
MDLDILSLFAHQGYRQLMIGSAGFVLGTIKGVWDDYREDTRNYIWINYDYQKVYEDTKIYDKNTKIKGRLLTLASIVIPSGFGIERAVSSNSLLANSYPVEIASDVAAAGTGFFAGEMVGYNYVSSLVKYAGRKIRRINH